MKHQKNGRRGDVPRVEKVLLQMTQRGDDWAGKATRFAGPAEFHFDSLRDLFDWLARVSKSK